MLRGQTLGIWGYGKIGQLVAGYGKAFGMNVLVYGREHSQHAAREDGFTVVEKREALFKQSDVLSVHLRLTDETRAIVKQDDLMRMKPTALFVNTQHEPHGADGGQRAASQPARDGRHRRIRERANSARLYGLLRMENVICTPHIGYVERESYELYFSPAFNNILAFDAGDTSSVFNKDALQHARRR